VNGIHDMGGMHGFGRIEVEGDEPVFHHDWERRVFGCTCALTAAGFGSIDAFRYAIERMVPEHYLRAGYYERWMTALASRLVENGVATQAELDAGARGRFPLSTPPAELAPVAPLAPRDTARFALGERVRVRNMHPAGHTRVPRYVRGMPGVVVRVDGRFALPDLMARGERRDEWAYGVRFAARDLWGETAPAGDAVHVDLWESYLEAP